MTKLAKCVIFIKLLIDLVKIFNSGYDLIAFSYFLNDIINGWKYKLLEKN